MYDVIQIIAKFIIILGIIIVATVMSLKVWRSDLDLIKLLKPGHIVNKSAEEKLSWLPTREEDAIYQNETVVARTKGEKINLEEGIIDFQELYKSDSFNRKAEFEFRKWKLSVIRIEVKYDNYSSRPLDGIILVNVRCKILGERGTK